MELLACDSYVHVHTHEKKKKDMQGSENAMSISEGLRKKNQRNNRLTPPGERKKKSFVGHNEV